MSEDHENQPEENTEDTGTVTEKMNIRDITDYETDAEGVIKAILFASTEYVTISTLKEIFEDTKNAKEIRTHIKNINKELKETAQPFEVAEVNNSFLFRTRPEYYPWVKKLFRETGARKLSQAALEILAIIAYKQPITKAEVEDIRGVNVDGTIKGLLDKKLVTISGKSEKIGNAYTYSTTKAFLQYFNINRIPQDLPKLSEFEELVQSSALIPQISGDEGEGMAYADDIMESEETDTMGPDITGEAPEEGYVIENPQPSESLPESEGPMMDEMSDKPSPPEEPGDG